ncbi:MAG: hypothetical protein J6C40_00185 [Lentisphaeria bacterium]|nr:hypothetical protein [Lentisphaeria bacterium]
MNSSNGNQFGKGISNITIGQHTETKLTGEMSPKQIDREQKISIAKLAVSGFLGICTLGVICFLYRK